MIEANRDEVVDMLNAYLKKDHDTLKAAIDGKLIVKTPSLLQGDPITSVEGKDTVIKLMNMFDMFHGSGVRIKYMVRKGRISHFF